MTLINPAVFCCSPLDGAALGDGSVNRLAEESRCLSGLVKMYEVYHILLRPLHLMVEIQVYKNAAK